jgi:hypothetical protein
VVVELHYRSLHNPDMVDDHLRPNGVVFTELARHGLLDDDGRLIAGYQQEQAFLPGPGADYRFYFIFSQHSSFN